METQNTKPAPAPAPGSTPAAIETSASRVACDGGPLGHPKIYLEFAEATQVNCPYCGQSFVRKVSAA